MQRSIEEALAILMCKPIPIVGADRIDTGVHARLMIIHFDWEEPIGGLVFLAKKLNRLPPKDIAIYKIVPVVLETYARFDATSRTYKYYVTIKGDPLNHELACKFPDRLDSGAMNEACKILFDYIDPTSFSRLHTDVKTDNCRVRHADWTQKGDIWMFTIRADRFLHNTVRVIVGTSLEIGKGRLMIDDLRNVIEAKNRYKAGTSVLRYILFLVNITYPEELFPTED